MLEEERVTFPHSTWKADSKADKNSIKGRRDGSTVKITVPEDPGLSSRTIWLLKPSVTLILEDLMTPPVLHKHCMNLVHKYRQNTNTHKK